MKWHITLRCVAPREHVQQLLTSLIDRLGKQVHHFPEEAVSLHVVFEENGARTLYRTRLTCHVPGRMLAAREERRDAGLSIHRAFSELERQLSKHKALVSRTRRHARNRTRMPHVAEGVA